VAGRYDEATIARPAAHGAPCRESVTNGSPVSPVAQRRGEWW
jgi:hypothetical protein